MQDTELAGGCSEPNDAVSDTAEEAAPQFGCPSPVPDSCPNKPSSQPRSDPIHSYMVSTLALPLFMGSLVDTPEVMSDLEN